MRVASVQLIHFSLSAPLRVTGSCISQISIGSRRKAARFIKICSEFAGDSLDMGETIRMARTDSLFVELFCFERSGFNPCDFRTSECSPAFEICWAMLGPHVELPGVIFQRVEVRFLLIRRCGIPRYGTSKRCMEAKIRR